MQRRQPQTEVTPAFDPEVFRARFALLRRADTREPEVLDRLVPVFEAHPRLAAAWQALRAAARASRPIGDRSTAG